MKFTSVKDKFFELCSFDSELLHNKNEKRPYLLIIKLKYKGNKCDFAIPFRSNISNYIPKEQYFSLPTRKTTQNNKIHGLHYIKMFPIHKQYLKQFYVQKGSYEDVLETFIKNNIKDVVQGAQSYLDKYEEGIRVEFSTNIESIYEIIVNMNQE